MWRWISGGLVAVVMAVQPAAAALLTATASLDGSQEVPPNASTATGSAAFTVDTETGAYTFSLDVTGIDITAVFATLAGGLHIHQAPAGANGPVVVNLSQNRGLSNIVTDAFTWTSSGTVTPAVIAALQDGNLYVNLHTESFNAGEIRGQLAAVPIPGAVLLLGTGVAGLAWLRRRRA